MTIQRLLSNCRAFITRLFDDSLHQHQFALVNGLQHKLDVLEKNDILERAIVWNTPKKRKTTERRNMARFGGKEWGTMKLIPINHKIRTDHKTGEFFELGRLAPLTYEKVMSETKAIQDKIQEAFGFSKQPMDKDIVVQYEGDKSEESNKKVIEMEKPRPSFFSSNLLQQARVKSSATKTTTVRPTGLG